MRIFFYFNVIKSNFISCVLWPVESKSDVHFRRPKPETFDNPENLNSILSEISGASWRKWIPDLNYRSKTLLNKYHLSGKFLLSPKFRVDKSECCAITVTKVKNFQIERVFYFYFINGCVFLPWIRIRYPLSSAVTGKPRSKFFFRITENLERLQGFPEADCDGTLCLRHFSSSHGCLQSALSRHLKLCFSPEKLNFYGPNSFRLFFGT